MEGQDITGASDWQGRVSASWAAEWERTDRSFAALNAKLVAHAVGLALDGRLPDAQICGIDLSADLMAIARYGQSAFAHWPYILHSCGVDLDGASSGIRSLTHGFDRPSSEQFTLAAYSMAA